MVKSHLQLEILTNTNPFGLVGQELDIVGYKKISWIYVAGIFKWLQNKNWLRYVLYWVPF